MPSTTTDVQPSTLALGFGVLHALISASGAPANVREEQAALRTLIHLHRGHPLDSALQQMRDELDLQVRRVDELRTEHLLGWIRRRSTWVERLHGRTNRKIKRDVLLLVLLARTVGLVTRYEIVRHLADRTRVEELLAWMPQRWCFPRTAGLIRLYLLATRDVLLGSEMRPAEEVSAKSFESWSWWIQVVHLEFWRKGWDASAHGPGAGSGVSPILFADRIEFQLAREGAFRRLRRLRPVAKMSLRDLQYRDHRSIEGPTRVAPVFVVLLVLVTGIAAWCSWQRVQTWDRANKGFARSILNECSNREP